MSTVKEIFETKIGGRLAANPDIASSINSVYQFELTGDDASNWILDLTKSSDYVSEGTHDDPSVTVTMTSADFISMVEGNLAPQMAFMTGKLKIKGEMALALKLQQILG